MPGRPLRFKSAVIKYLNEHATETKGVTRKELFQNLPSEIIGTDNEKRFEGKVTRLGVLPGFETKKGVGTIKISKDNINQTEVLMQVIDTMSPRAAMAKPTKKSLAVPSLIPKTSPLALNKLVSELGMLQLQINNIQAQIIAMIGV